MGGAAWRLETGAGTCAGRGDGSNLSGSGPLSSSSGWYHRLWRRRLHPGFQLRARESFPYNLPINDAERCIHVGWLHN